MKTILLKMKLMAILALIHLSVSAQTWQLLGTFPSDMQMFLKNYEIQYNPVTNKLILAYGEASASFLKVKQYDGNTWSDLGTLSGWPTASDIDLQINNNSGDVYVKTYNKIHHYSGSTWTTINLPIGLSFPSRFVLSSVDYEPHIFYGRIVNGGFGSEHVDVVVERYNNGNWITVVDTTVINYIATFEVPQLIFKPNGDMVVSFMYKHGMSGGSSDTTFIGAISNSSLTTIPTTFGDGLNRKHFHYSPITDKINFMSFNGKVLEIGADTINTIKDYAFANTFMPKIFYTVTNTSYLFKVKQNTTVRTSNVSELGPGLQKTSLDSAGLDFQASREIIYAVDEPNNQLYVGGMCYVSPDYLLGIYKIDMNSLGVSNYEISKSIGVFPNPTEGKVSLEFRAPGPNLCKVYNSIGEKVYEKNIHSKSEKIDLSFLQSGIYTIEVANADQISKQKLIIAH